VTPELSPSLAAPLVTGNLMLQGILLAVALLVTVAAAVGGYALLLRRRNERTAARRGRLEGVWLPRVLQALEDPAAARALALAVPGEDRLFFVGFVLRTVGQLAGHEKEALVEALRPHLPLVEKQLVSRREEARARAVRTLATVDLDRYLPRVVDALDDPSPVVRVTAARALARPDRPRLLEELLPRLERFAGWRHGFLSAVLAGVGFEAAPLLREVLSDAGRAPWIRSVAAEALALLRDPEAGDVAARVLEGATHVELQVASLRVMGAAGVPHHLLLLRELATNPNPAIRAAAMAALGRIHGAEEMELLQEGLADPSPWVALRTAEGLLEGGGSDPLRELADSERTGCIAARQALASAGRLA
jgi:HEAT repeat protein